MTHRSLFVPALAAVILIGGCSAPPSPSVTEAPTATEAQTIAPTEAPTPTPAPALSLELPAAMDPRQVTVAVTPAVAPDADGQITVTVTSGAADLVDELVVRWPTDLGASLVLFPFVPDANLVREGGGNLVRPWTKWVVGPGEQGEPAGTTSLGYGPLDAAATLTIPIYVTRVAPGPVSFDLQVLAGESILTLPDGLPAELRVEIP